METHGLFKPTWDSLAKHTTPQWFKDAKFGIYTHWGVYCVPAKGPNATWYPYNMYREGTPQWEYHVKTYGGPEKFGWKDFIPMFTAEQFDPDELAELFRESGAQFAGPVGEHHDSFCMWDTQYSEWSAAKMGPKTDVVGRLEKAIRKQGMRFLVALHHAENWWFYPHWRKEFDTSDPHYVGLYGEAHDLEGKVGKTFFEQIRPSKKFIGIWKAKILEVIDKYDPDVLCSILACAAYRINPKRNSWPISTTRPTSAIRKWRSLLKPMTWLLAVVWSTWNWVGWTG